jgi:hypothetical protein
VTLVDSSVWIDYVRGFGSPETNKLHLHLSGITVRKTIDTVIATRCIWSGYSLLYSDRDFDPQRPNLLVMQTLGRTVEPTTNATRPIWLNSAAVQTARNQMQRYSNNSGESGVVAYDINAGSITVEFAGGERYLYTEASAGAANIARMQRLALAGRGLSTFISQVVRDGYARKFK